MPIPNQYLIKHNRIYVYLNPDPETGPYAFCLSDVPPESDDPQVGSIYTVLPIDSVVTGDGDMTLFFNIDDLAEVGTPQDQADRTGLFAANMLLKSGYETQRTLNGITSVTGITPVEAERLGGKIAIYFDIQGLEELGNNKRRFSARLNTYNRGSIDKLSADKPLFTSGIDDIVVTFDISSLENA